MIVNATNGAGSIAALELAGEEHLSGKVLLDIANPLDFSGGMRPTLSVVNDDSLGERIQRRFRDARVVKALNTMNAHLMVDPNRLAGGGDSVFVCGDITSARGTEMYLPLWLRLSGAVGRTDFSIKVVR